MYISSRSSSSTPGARAAEQPQEGEGGISADLPRGATSQAPDSRVGLPALHSRQPPGADAGERGLEALPPGAHPAAEPGARAPRRPTHGIRPTGLTQGRGRGWAAGADILLLRCAECGSRSEACEAETLRRVSIVNIIFRLGSTRFSACCLDRSEQQGPDQPALAFYARVILQTSHIMRSNSTDDSMTTF